MTSRLRPLVVVLAGFALLALPAAAPAATCKGVPKRSCLLPFPNDFAQTKADRTTPNHCMRHEERPLRLHKLTPIANGERRKLSGNVCERVGHGSVSSSSSPPIRWRSALR